MLATCKTCSRFAGGVDDQDVRDHCMTLLCRQNNAVTSSRAKSEQMGFAWHILMDKNMILYIMVSHTRLADDRAGRFLQQLSGQLYEQNAEFKKNPQTIESLEGEARGII